MQKKYVNASGHVNYSRMSDNVCNMIPKRIFYCFVWISHDKYWRVTGKNNFYLKLDYIFNLSQFLLTLFFGSNIEAKQPIIYSRKRLGIADVFEIPEKINLLLTT